MTFITEDPPIPELIAPQDAVVGADAPSNELRDATLEGVRWITYGRVAYEILAIASLAILAHLIRPAEYGHVAIALILQSLAIVLTGEGFGNPLVQRKLIGKGHLESATLMSVAAGVLLGVVVFAAAPLVITPLYGARTTHLFQLAALLFPIYGCIIVPEAILQRRLDLRRVTIVETAGSLVGAILSIILAVLGFSGTSIILGAVAGAVVTAVMLLVMVGMPKPRWHRAEAREVTSYGTFASLAGLVSLGVRNVDNAIVGARLGATQLGLYYRAFALGVNNQLKIGLILLRVAFPALSRSDDPEEMRKMRDRMARLNSVVVIPLLVLLAITAPKLVPFVFGSHWKLAIVPTQILAFAGIATALTYCSTPFLLASGHPRAVFKLNAATLVVYLGAILVAVPHGLRAVCGAVVAANVVTMVASYALSWRLAGVPLRRMWDDSAPATVSSIALAAVALPLTAVLSDTSVPAFGILAVVGVLGGAAYLVTLHFLFRSAFADMLLIVKGLLPRGWRPLLRVRERPAPARPIARPWMVVAVALPLIAFGIAYTARRASLHAPISHSAALAARQATTAAAVNLLGVAPVGSPNDLKIPARPRPRPHPKPAVSTPPAPSFVAPRVVAPAASYNPAPSGASGSTPSSGGSSHPTPAPPTTGSTGQSHTGGGTTGTSTGSHPPTPTPSGTGSGGGGSTGTGTVSGGG